MRHRRRGKARTILRALSRSGSADRPSPCDGPVAAPDAKHRRAATVLRPAMGYMAMAAPVPRLLLANRDGAPRPRSGILPLRGEGRGHVDPRADDARAAGARSVRQPVRALDSHRHARRRAAVRAARGALRHDSRRSRSSGMALPVDGGVSRSFRCVRVRALQPERPVRIRADRPLPPDAGIDRAMQPPGRAPRRRPEHLAHRLRPLDEVAEALHRSDRAFFYSAFRVEQVQ